eukprot:COSAG02_NODE_5487_length_4287_cov_40.035112_4_plen_407_part_00
MGHKQAVAEFLKGTFSKGREERAEDKELQEELRAIEEAALKTFETDLRKKGVNNYRDTARQALHDNRLSRQGVRPPPRRDWGGTGEPTGEAAAAAEEIPEWKRAQLEAARQLELASLWYYIDAAGTQQGPHPLSSMQGWYNAGYFPPGTMVARDGEGDETAWVDISVCYQINQQPDPAQAGKTAAAATSAGNSSHQSLLEERKAALGMSDQTADVVERRSAGSGMAAFQDKRAAMRKAKAKAGGTDANNVPLGDKKQSISGAAMEGAPHGDNTSDDTPSGAASDDDQDSDDGSAKPLPEVADVKKGRDEKTGFGAWSTVSYKTAYTAPVDNGTQHAYKTPSADGDDSSGEEEDSGAPKLEARTEWHAATGGDSAKQVSFKKRKLKRYVAGCRCLCVRVVICAPLRN